jgi:hypothetical protein
MTSNMTTSDTAMGKRTNSLPKERRRAKRAMLRVRADVTLPGDLTIESHTMDISTTGLSFDVPYELQVAERCVVEFDLKKMGGRRFELVAIVRNCRADPQGKFHAGLEFQAPPAELSATLEKVLA